MKRIPGLTMLLVCSGILSQSQSAARAPEIRAHISRAEAALRTNDQEVAAREFRSVLGLDPMNTEANTNLGVMEFARGDCNSASEHLRPALRLLPSLTKAEALLGICERRVGDASAKIHLEKSFAKLQDPKLRAQVGMELVSIYYGEGSADRALPVVQKLVEIDPDNPDILYTAQRLYNELADDTLNKLAIIAPNSARMQQTIAERLINAGDLQSAIAHYRKALQIDPHLPGLHYELAEAIYESAQSDPETQAAVKQEIEQATKTEGNSSKLECLRGSISLLEGDLPQANEHYADALKRNPSNPEAQLGLGRVLMMMDKPEQARKYLQMAAASDPLNPTAHYRLAMTDKRLGLQDEAQKEARLTQEIKRTQQNVQRLYQEMHKQTRPEEAAMDQDK